jgi:hypothetical protein
VRGVRRAACWSPSLPSLASSAGAARALHVPVVHLVLIDVQRRCEVCGRDVWRASHWGTPSPPRSPPSYGYGGDPTCWRRSQPRPRQRAAGCAPITNHCATIGALHDACAARACARAPPPLPRRHAGPSLGRACRGSCVASAGGRGGGPLHLAAPPLHPPACCHNHRDSARARPARRSCCRRRPPPPVTGCGSRSRLVFAVAQKGGGGGGGGASAQAKGLAIAGTIAAVGFGLAYLIEKLDQAASPSRAAARKGAGAGAGAGRLPAGVTGPAPPLRATERAATGGEAGAVAGAGAGGGGEGGGGASGRCVCPEFVCVRVRARA